MTASNPAPTSQSGPPHRRHAFTITELLVVVAIIALLISILTPSLVNVKKIARAARTAALLKGLGDGLEMFHADQVVGGDYPPSYWVASQVRVGNPYEAENQDSTKRKSPYYAQGAQTLVWGLVGADLQGTPGFVGLLGGQNGIYSLDTAKRPTHNRRDPFVNLSKTRIGNPDSSIMLFRAMTSQNPDNFVPPPVFIDDFDMPVLYYKPNTANSGAPLAIYARDDNLGFIGGISPDTNASHRMAYQQRLYHDASLNLNLTAFQKYIRNVQITTAYQPHNPDTFILISAGADQDYGTEDDVTNFPLNAYNTADPNTWR